jgi:hypothetical protein
VTHLEQFFGFCAAAAVVEILPILNGNILSFLGLKLPELD